MFVTHASEICTKLYGPNNMDFELFDKTKIKKKWVFKTMIFDKPLKPFKKTPLQLKQLFSAKLLTLRFLVFQNYGSPILVPG